MSDCDKTGCRKIAYVCEDCGRKTNTVDLSPLIGERNALKAELDRLKTGKTQFCVQCERYARELEEYREAATRLLLALESVIKSDRSKEYEYGERNKNGIKPGVGKRWLTPKEIARGIIAKETSRWKK